MTPDEIIDQQIEDNFKRAEWKHLPAPTLTDHQKNYIGQLRDLFTEAHANMLSCTPSNPYQERAEEALEVAAMWAVKSITHNVTG